MEITSNSARKTQKIAQVFARTLKPQDTIGLYGTLGSGKSVFVRGIAKGLGINRQVLSPTFLFLRVYPFRYDHRMLTFYHVDLYRAKALSDYTALGLAELFSKDSIVAIEWAEKIKDILPKKRIDVFIRIKDEKTRKIRIKRY